MPTYAGINGVVRKLKEWPVGVDGVARQQTEVWAGISGVKRQIFEYSKEITISATGNDIANNGYAYALVNGTRLNPGSSVVVQKNPTVLIYAAANDIYSTISIKHNGASVGETDEPYRLHYYFYPNSDTQIRFDVSLAPDRVRVVITGGT